MIALFVFALFLYLLYGLLSFLEDDNKKSIKDILSKKEYLKKYRSSPKFKRKK